METRKICIATSTRADWGLLIPLAKSLQADTRAAVQILATNMHLLSKYGYTADEIEAAGFNIDAKVEMPDSGDSPADKVAAMSVCMQGSAAALERLRPDILVLLGDRYETLAIASAANVMGIPIAHIAGGEISEGAIDDSIRHAVTKLSALHFTETEQYRQRVIQLGENPDRVFDAGSLGVWNIMHQPLMDTETLQNTLNFDITKGNILLSTYHPATLSTDHGVGGCKAMLEAFDCFPDYHIVITYPNNDAGSDEIISLIKKYAEERPERVTLVKSLGMQCYLSLLRYGAAVVGNSSSGIIEVPSIGIPTVDIEPRQRGRISAPSVIHCSPTTSDIRQAIEAALSPEMRKVAECRINPYQKQDTVGIIAENLLNCDLSILRHKKFYDK